MRADLILSTATLLGFLLTLARVSGVFVFVPIPGMGSQSNSARIVLALSITVALYPYWPHPSGEVGGGLLAMWLVSEAALGIGMGLSVSFIIESFNVAGQIMGLQAGFAYASTIDPNSQADSSVLVVFAEMASGLIFFALGLHREVFRIFARSMEVAPAGSFTLARGAGAQLILMGGVMFSTAMRLAMPVVAVLLLVDISLALLGRVNAQLQLLTIAFPVKMLVGLAVFSWLLLLAPVLLRSDASAAFRAVQSLTVR